MLLTLSPLDARGRPVRLACLIHAASVHSEPGSNSPLQKKFDTPGRLTGRFQFLGGNLRPSSRPAQVRALRPKELNCLSIASYCAALLPRSPSPLRATPLLYHRFRLLQAAAAIFRELFFFHPSGPWAVPWATSLSYHGFPSLQAAAAIFSPRARPDGQAARISGMSVPFPFRHSPIMSLPSVPCGTVRRARSGAGQKKATGAPTGLLPAGVRRGEVWRRGQKSPSSGLAATGCIRMS